MENCKHDKYEKCAFCKANDHAAYELTGTHDRVKQQEYWRKIMRLVAERRKVML